MSSASQLEFLQRPNTDHDTDSMSYAAAAAPHGKKQQQTDEEKVPDAVPEIMHEDSGVHSLDSLNSVDTHIQSLPSDTSYAGQQEAEERAEQIRLGSERQADEVAKEARDFTAQAEQSARDLKSSAKSESKSFSSKAEAKFESAKGKAKEEYEEVKKQTKAAASKAEKEGKKAEEWADKNKQNPVVLGNAVAIAALGALLGTGAYRMHKANTLTWNVVGACAGVVGLFAVGDYYVSQYFFKKYPPKN